MFWQKNGSRHMSMRCKRRRCVVIICHTGGPSPFGMRRKPWCAQEISNVLSKVCGVLVSLLEQVNERINATASPICNPWPLSSPHKAGSNRQLLTCKQQHTFLSAARVQRVLH